jgi:hypothetical protein
MATVRGVDFRLQQTLKEGYKLLELVKRRHAELALLRQSLPKSRKIEREEILQLCESVLQYQVKLKEDVKEAAEVAHKIEGHLLWKDAVHAIWGEAGLQQCYAHMSEQEAQRSKLFEATVGDGL